MALSEGNVASLFDFPEIYAVVMARPADIIAQEVTSVERLLAQQGVPQGRILELACGTAAHGLPLAERGHMVCGLDRSPAMLAAAHRRAAAANVPLALYEADVVEFDLPEANFDCALFLYETFQLLTEYADLVSHFAAVRRHLKPGGLYIIDLSPCRHGVGRDAGEWGRQTLALPNGYVETWNHDNPGDWIHGTSHLVVHCRIEQAGRSWDTVDDWRLRMYSPWELTVLVRTLAGWVLDGFYHWRDLSANIVDADHYWMVLRTVASD